MSKFVLLFALFIGVAVCAVGDACSKGGQSGTCQTTCADPKKFVSGACPYDPANVMCCVGGSSASTGNDGRASQSAPVLTSFGA